MELFEKSGMVKPLGKRLKEMSQIFDTVIVEGFAEPLEHNCYQYDGLFKYSFTDLREAFGLRQTGGEFLEFSTRATPDLNRPYVTFVLEAAMGNGAAFPQPTGQFDLLFNGRKIISFTLVKYDTLWETGGNRLYFQIKKKIADNLGRAHTLDEWIKADNTVVNGLMFLRVPARLMNGETSARIRIVPNNPEKSMNWLRLGLCRSVIMTDIESGLAALTDGKNAPELAGKKAYFGDIHTHSADGKYLGTEGCGLGTWEENFNYARNISCLDFFCMSDHDWQMDAKDWKNLRAITDKYNEPGRFATLKGFEWTSYFYGHRNVYFRNTDIEEIFDFRSERFPVRFGLKGISLGDPTPKDLWAWLNKNNLEAIVVPHHPNADQFLMSMDHFFNPRYERLVEIYSCWGSADEVDHEANMNNDKFASLSVPQYLDRLNFGLIASSDSHDGHPGNAGLAHGHRYFLGHHLGSGRAAVLAESLCREDVYDALKERRCFATTGTPLALSLMVNGNAMGLETKARPGQTNEIKAEIKAPDRISRLEIVRDNEVIYEEEALGSSATVVCLEDRINENSRAKTNYRLKVWQEDGETAWSSPVFLEFT